MIGSWSGTIKKPIPVLEAFIETKKGTRCILNIIGDGSQLNTMKELVVQHKMESQVIYHGKQPKEFISEILDKTDYLLHNSLYETFSVVTAEALCSGCRVIISHQDCIKEYLKPEDGTSVKGTDRENWIQTLKDINQVLDPSEKQRIGQYYWSKFNRKTIGEQYFGYLKESNR